MACNPAKVEVQVRFLARTLATLEPDGTAAACKAAFGVGSTPTSVSSIATTVDAIASGALALTT